MINQRCKGARDLLPEDTERFRYIEDTFRSICIKWGFREVKTPTIEPLHLFTSAGTLTPSMLSKVYSFLDWDGWSGERVVLRPDGTIPVTRLYIENMSEQKICKLFYVTNVFTFEETGKEDRERWQCGVELFGDVKPTADVEIIMTISEIIRNLGIGDIKIQLFHAGILKKLIKDLHLSPAEEAELLNQIGEGNWEILTCTNSAKSDIGNFLSSLLHIKGENTGFLRNLKALPGVSKELGDEIDNFAEVTNLLDALGCNYQIDVTSSSGFEYYTGLCFQLLKGNVIIGGGGRYNNLVPLIGGERSPACGFAIYIDPLMNLVKPKGGENAERGVLIKGKTTSPEITKSCFDLAQSLRDLGYIAELDFNEYKANWRWVITVQEDPEPFVVFDQSLGKTSQEASITRVIEKVGGLI